MPVTVIVGGQYGSEGKGKVAHCLASEMGAFAAVRVGGSNSGHTVIDGLDNPIIFRHLPTASILPDVICVLAAGSYISPTILLQEIAASELPKERLIIDPQAVIITEHEEAQERAGSLRRSIGSTLSGTGAAVRRRIDRENTVILAKHESRLAAYVKPVGPFLRDALSADKRIIVEGTQGFGLSLLHSTTYPFVTSRDTTAAAFVSEVGLSPFDVDDIVMVLRAFPIRVGGNSGPLMYEIDWDTITNESGSPTQIIERTSVTKNVRRVGRFDPEIVRQAIRVNRPTRIVLNHVDYFDVRCARENRLSERAVRFVDDIEARIEASVDYVGLGPNSFVPVSKRAAKLKLA